MKGKYQNWFLAFGLVVLAIMVSQLNIDEVCAGVKRAGYWFPAVILLWAALYVLNTASWYVIIHSQGSCGGRVSFAWLYKVTVSGFAINYATPGGLMGGEPYRIMELAPRIGTERASSSVILYVMTHIFSHFWFWLVSILLYLCFYVPDALAVSVIVPSAVFCVAGLWFFISGYRKGVALRLLGLARHIPWVRGRAERFVRAHGEQLDKVDGQIAALHAQNRWAFILAVSFELLCRILSALEIMFVIEVLSPGVSFVSCVIILAFTSLVANLLFFIPLQLGGRESGFLMSTAGLSMTASTGIFVALIVRLRELVWTAIGLLLIKLGARAKRRG